MLFLSQPSLFPIYLMMPVFIHFAPVGSEMEVLVQFPACGRISLLFLTPAGVQQTAGFY
jgi:hypothetical protein